MKQFFSISCCFLNITFCPISINGSIDILRNCLTYADLCLCKSIFSRNCPETEIFFVFRKTDDLLSLDQFFIGHLVFTILRIFFLLLRFVFFWVFCLVFRRLLFIVHIAIWRLLWCIRIDRICRLLRRNRHIWISRDYFYFISCYRINLPSCFRCITQTGIFQISSLFIVSDFFIMNHLQDKIWYFCKCITPINGFCL